MDEDLCLVCAPSLAPKLQNIEDINHVTLPETHYKTRTVGILSGLNTHPKHKPLASSILPQLPPPVAWGSAYSAIFIEEQLANGSLIFPLTPFTSPYRYYLLTPKSPSLPLKPAFIDWLFGSVCALSPTKQHSECHHSSKVR